MHEIIKGKIISTSLPVWHSLGQCVSRLPPWGAQNRQQVHLAQPPWRHQSITPNKNKKQFF
jgi:hypothetical protein